jgi:FtsZ-binding cell division protein ZapB
MVNRKGDAATHFLNEVFEKMEVKLMQVDQQVALLKMETNKERENLGRVEVTAFKNSEEFRGMLNQLNGEFSNRLEVKLTDLVNRLLSE